MTSKGCSEKVIQEGKREVQKLCFAFLELIYVYKYIVDKQGKI